MTFSSRSLILANTSLSEPVGRLIRDAKRKKNDPLDYHKYVSKKTFGRKEIYTISCKALASLRKTVIVFI